MEFTLRQARNLEKKIRAISIQNPSIKVRAYDSDVARSDLRKGVRELEKNIEYNVRMNENRFHIKNEINRMNMKCGVSTLLNTRDMLFSERDMLSKLGKGDTEDRQVSYIDDNPTDTRVVSVYTEDLECYVEKKLLDISNQLAYIADLLNDLNDSVTVDIDSDYIPPSMI